MFDFLKRKIRYAYRSPKWRTVREEHLSHQPNCQVCNRDKDLEVHHIVPVHIAEELELDRENLITLCSKCHLIFGHLYDYKSWNENVTKDAQKFNKSIKNRPYKN
ncbi:MAG TPA: HNH endonuclease signature motif containing protein [Candidatus Glassbacteria bacterium]|jgi:5-methylcytosine-specific restriction enzyme A|nr:HNH endonuclease signature motif containing protein [Candidatus Glassbacteria bacterium]